MTLLWIWEKKYGRHCPPSMHVLDVTRFCHFSIMASASFRTDGLTLRTKACCQRPTNITVEQTTHLEKSLLSVYYLHMTGISDLNFQRMQGFEHSVQSNLRLLPLSKAGHIEHIKRATFETSWVAY